MIKCPNCGYVMEEWKRRVVPRYFIFGVIYEQQEYVVCPKCGREIGKEVEK